MSVNVPETPKNEIDFFSGRLAASILRSDGNRDLFTPLGLGEGNWTKHREF